MDNTNAQNYRDLENLARLMDDRFEILGFKFGFNFLLDLIPGVGDVLTTAIAAYLLYAAYRYRASYWARLRIFMNIAIYFLIGLIPWFGDIFQTWFKPNRRNLRILRRDLAAK